MPPDFMTELLALADDFEQALGERGASKGARVEATADIGAEIRKGMIAVRTMDAPVRNKYANDPGKLAAWTSASHVRKEPETPAPEQPDKP